MTSIDADSRFAGRVDCENVAVTGMSFGGFTSAAALELEDPRIQAAVLMCPAMGFDTPPIDLSVPTRKNKHSPILLMTGREDTVLGAGGMAKCASYFAVHEGPKCLVELIRGGHVSFTSCELYNAEYGNGIG